MSRVIRLIVMSAMLAWVPVAAVAQMEFEAVSVGDDKESMAELEAALKAYKRRDFLRASLVLHRLVSRNEVAVSGVEQKAEYTLGKTLYRLGLYQAAINFFDRVVKAGPDHRYFKATCKWLYYLSRKLSGDPGLLDRISKYRPEDCPVEFRNELFFLLGQYHYKKGEIDVGLKHLRRVTPESPYFPKAKFLEGISLVRKDTPKPAAESFKDLLRVTVKTDNPTEDLKYFNQLAVLSLARVFYSTGQFRQSVKYYDQIPLDSRLWLDALFESSWAYFRLNNHEKALGNLHTLNSPFFSEEFYPEAPILAGVIFYSNCNYRKTRDTIGDFRTTYEPLKDEIKGYLDAYADPAEFFQFLQNLQKSGTAVSPRIAQILSAAFQDKQLRRIGAYVTELEREIALIEKSTSNWSRSPLAQQIIQEVEITKSLAVHNAGQRARTRLNRVVQDIGSLISQSLKIEFEVASAEKGVAENSLQGIGAAKRKGAKGPQYATDDEHIYWPFTGEYWRDELGYYLYTIQSECAR